MRSTLVAPDTVGYVWPQAERFIQSAFAKHTGDESEASVLALLAKGEAQLWIAHNGTGIKAAAITRMAMVNSGRRICFCVACGGEDFDQWAHTLGDIEKWARKQGCDAVRITGRPGWRVYKKQGYKEPFVVLEKALQE